MEKVINVFKVKDVKTGSCVSFPTMKKAEECKIVLELFGIQVTIEKLKKNITL